MNQPHPSEDERTGMSPEAWERAVRDHLRFTRAKDLRTAHLIDVYFALAHSVRDRLVHRWIRTAERYEQTGAKRIYYLSAEYLLGRQLESNLLNLGCYDVVKAGLKERGLELEAILEQEPDPGLGNGGLGRLAACFMDSLATLEYPAMGYGIRYEFGIFRQEIADGWQVEHPDDWLRAGNPWEIARPEYTVEVPFGGEVNHYVDQEGRFQARWQPSETVLGVPYDTPVAGFNNDTVNTLRLWSAEASEGFDLAVFNDGDYRRAVERKSLSESISKVLYPKDDSPEGKELRLRQQFFFVCCSLHDLIRRHKRSSGDLSSLPDHAAIQLNDTHPAIAVAELMRLLVDREQLTWEEAWDITQRTIAYTNHTLLPEALERWSLPLFERLLPRHLQIIYEINRRFLRELHLRAPNDEALQRRLSIIEESEPRQIRMAHLSVIGSHTVNGVAALHSQLIRERVLKDFADLWPERFTNRTNGVTPRRWLVQCNRPLADLLTDHLGGTGWVSDLDQIGALDALAEDAGFVEEIRRIKRSHKRALADYIQQRFDEAVDPETLFDVQIKRIHEYKRQLMLCLHAVHLYWRIKFAGEDIVPRTILFGGKAAPGYAQAKRTIKLINDVAATVNRDPAVRGRLKVLFLANYNVSMAERIIPATELSEQISMAGKEASGTGNMKFQMNGALTLGTLDGANIEIREAVGPENFFLFGHDADEVVAIREAGYRPADWVSKSPDLERALALIASGFFNPDEPALHSDIARYVGEYDPYLICADFEGYVQAQSRAAAAWKGDDEWWRMSARNTLRSARFSSDRTIREYAEGIWGLSRTPVGGE